MPARPWTKLALLAFAASGAALAQCALNSTQPSVTICSPAKSSTVADPLHFVALTNSATTVTSMDVLVDSAIVYSVAANKVDTTLTLTPGARHILIRGKNTAGTTFWKSEDITVTSGTPRPSDCPLNSTQPSVTICSPAQGSTVADPVHFLADTNSATAVTSMDILVDSAVVYSVAANRVDTTLTLTPGARHILIRGKNTAGTTFWKSEDITVTGSAPPGLSELKHIIWMFQENRSFDHYFGHMNDYRTSIGLPADVDGTPANASNASTDGTVYTPFHLATSCMEDLTPGWTESHRDFNLQTPTSETPMMDGFVWNAAHMAQYSGFHDTEGRRAMGYYTSDELNYYYFMASQFAMSDRWFSPVPTDSPDNRLYGLAATSQGYVHNPGQLTAKTIFEELQNAGISWKVYYSDKQSDGEPATRMNNFWGFTKNHLDKIVPISQYFTDLQNNTLPQVAFIEAGTLSGRDEHPGTADPSSTSSGTRIQVGAAYVASIINGLMQSSSWRTSAFILSWDEDGGFYDHVPPMLNVPNPDGIKPKDLKSGDTVSDFTRTGFRVPMMVVSPFSKQNYVSHTPADYTAILKLIETRFNLPALTKRDAAQIDMTEFFDFTNPPWLIPPNPPVQNADLACHNNSLP
jgi:phospholipase C